MKLSVVAAAVWTAALVSLGADAQTVRPAPYLGVIEGFCGVVWAPDARVSMIRWIARLRDEHSGNSRSAQTDLMLALDDIALAPR